MHAKARVEGDPLSIPMIHMIHRRPPAPMLEAVAARYPQRHAAIVTAYATSAYSYREIAAYHDVHLATVGRIVRRAMQQSKN